MADPSLYTYPSPLEGYRDRVPLPKFVPRPSRSHLSLTEHSDLSEDGKSYVNPPAESKSEAYNSFVAPITNGTRGGFEYVIGDLCLVLHADGSQYPHIFPPE